MLDVIWNDLARMGVVKLMIVLVVLYMVKDVSNQNILILFLERDDHFHKYIGP